MFLVKLTPSRVGNRKTKQRPSVVLTPPHRKSLCEILHYCIQRFFFLSWDVLPYWGGRVFFIFSLSCVKGRWWFSWLDLVYKIKGVLDTSTGGRPSSTYSLTYCIWHHHAYKDVAAWMTILRHHHLGNRFLCNLRDRMYGSSQYLCM